MLNETCIRCFLVMAETLNFTETARKVHLTQQAVSKNIGNLEQTLGFLLFDRSRSSISLTHEGVKCRDMFEKMTAMYENTLYDLRARQAGYLSSLNVGYQDFIDFGIGLINANNNLKQNHPDLMLTVARYSPWELIELLRRDELDLIVVYTRFLPADHDYATCELLRLQNLLMVSPDNPHLTENSTYVDFMNEPYLIDKFQNETTVEFEQRVQSELSLYGLTPSRIISLPNRESVYSAAALGNGILIGSDFSHSYKDDRLLKFKTESTIGLSCAWKGTGTKSIVLKYVEYLQKAYGE